MKVWKKLGDIVSKGYNAVKCDEDVSVKKVDKYCDAFGQKYPTVTHTRRRKVKVSIFSNNGVWPNALRRRHYAERHYKVTKPNLT